MEQMKPQSSAPKWRPVLSWTALLLPLVFLLFIGMFSGELGAYRSSKKVARWALEQVHQGQAIERGQRLRLYRVLHLIRKPAHVLLYGLFALSLCNIIRNTTYSQQKARLVIILFCLLIAGLDEWHQSLFPDRTALFSDVILDGLAATLAVWLHSLRYRRRAMDTG